MLLPDSPAPKTNQRELWYIVKKSGYCKPAFDYIATKDVLTGCANPILCWAHVSGHNHTIGETCVIQLQVRVLCDGGLGVSCEATGTKTTLNIHCSF